MNTFKGYSETGPRDCQQDAFQTYSSDNFETGLVCDGVGGNSGGEYASRTVAQTIVDSIEQWSRFNSSDDLMNQMIQAVDTAHQRICNDANIKPELQGMATTIALACVQEDMAHILWSGDSRVYLLRNGQLTCLTQDHSVVEQMVIDGKLTKDQARCHPDNNTITRAIGFGNCRLDGRVINLKSGDGLLLSSDGVMDSLNDRDILKALSELSEESDQLVAQTVVNAAIEAGTTDNTTAVWYRHHKLQKEPVTSFHRLQMAQVVNNNYERTESMQSSNNQPQYQIEIIDSLGNSLKHKLSGSLEIGRNPQSGLPIDDPYLDLFHVKLKPTNEGVKVCSLSSRVGTFIRLSDEPVILRAPFELLAGSTLFRISPADNTERNV